VQSRMKEKVKSVQVQCIHDRERQRPKQKYLLAKLTLLEFKQELILILGSLEGLV
jgi:hypothetical protein